MGGNLSSSKLLAGPSNDLVVQTIAVEPSSSTSTPSNVSTRVRNLVCNETRIHQKYLHLSAVPDNLRGGEQRFLSLKSDTCYLILMNTLVSPNVKILQLLKTNNFVMQIVWPFI